MGEATPTKCHGAYDVVAPTGGYTAGQVVQAANGLAAYIEGLRSLDANDPASQRTEGLVELPKTTGIVFIDGQEVFWDASANKLHFKRGNHADFSVGTVVGDAASAATTAVVDLNKKPSYAIALGDPATFWTTEAALGLGVSPLTGGGAILAFDAVAEIAQAALLSVPTVLHTAKPVLEAWIAIFDIGDDAALDITIGLASGSHASDFQSVDNFVAIHFDGGDLTAFAESDDGTTDVAPTTTGVDVVDDTPFFLQIDARDPDDVRILLNGVDVTPATLALTAATLELRPIVHLEKTSDNTTADVRVMKLAVRTSGNV